MTEAAAQLARLRERLAAARRGEDDTVKILELALDELRRTSREGLEKVEEVRSTLCEVARSEYPPPMSASDDYEYKVG